MVCAHDTGEPHTADSAVEASSSELADKLRNTPEEDLSALDKRLIDEVNSYANPFVITPFKPTYILPVNYTSHGYPDIYGDTDLQDIEVKFQISLKMPIWVSKGDVPWAVSFAYSQVSLWQAYNGDESSPFRETNYEPELFATWYTDYNFISDWHLRLIDLSFVHQSNGRGEPLSRSWNRIEGRFAFEKGNWALGLSSWYRIKEDFEDDNNPDLTDYMGHTELGVAYKWGQHTFTAMSRNNIESGFSEGAVQGTWSFPMGQRIKGYVQVFSGYGNSLAEYNHYTNTVGIGIAINDVL
ncbi:phospholipase [Motilimonas pumila]|uniref:Phospholipase A1 n=2 Tax=Motilimonas pumila TaxID=2303987 RepID=A0A418YHN7_9GAMM|nr:phospholipase [Motilimonas pumila]